MKCILFLSIVFCILLDQSLVAQQTNLDYKVTITGPVHQTITNMGNFGVGLTTPLPGTFDCEFPAGSRIEYGPFGIWIGARRAGTPLLTEGGPWENHFENRYEFFPTAEPWDSVWVVNRGSKVNIPYWPDYTGISDQDLVCHYNDYTIKNIPDHKPLDIEVIQVTYSWTSSEFLVHQFWLIPKQENLRDVWVGIFGNAVIGLVGASLGNDEFGEYDAVNKMGIMKDLPDYADTPLGPIGFRIFPDTGEESLSWTWLDGSADGFDVTNPPTTDVDRYRHISAGIHHDAIQSTKYGHFLYACGPFQIDLGDTLHYTLGQILGEGYPGLYENYERLQTVRDQEYHMPAPPPLPPLRIETANHQVTLNWTPKSGDEDPETYQDPYRRDGETQPFEGYRVYKSFSGLYGPWILLAEFDRDDDPYGNNIGLQRSYTDYGLLNNIEYYYTVTAFSKPDTVLGVISQESSLNANSVMVITGTAAPQTVGQVAVVPNPYRGDEKYYDYKPAWEKTGMLGVWTEENRRIQFINLPPRCTIKIYSLSGVYVNSISHDDQQRGFEDWNLTSYVGQAIASGIYLFTVKDLNNGNIQSGKFVVIK
jgi:hypothetical protein